MAEYLDAEATKDYFWGDASSFGHLKTEVPFVGN